MSKTICIIGAGFTGATIANQLAREGHAIRIFDERDHIAGNCHTERDLETNILIHKYGPHIFHTDDERVWNFVNSFSKFLPYINRVKSVFRGCVYSLPINLHTINHLFNKAMSPEEAKNFIKSKAVSNIKNPKNFEEQALKFVGNEIYEAFFKGYTLKQWGRDPKLLPASILKRLPLRFNYDDNYFNHRYQGMPEHGYTALVEKMIDHKNIELNLNTKISSGDISGYDHSFYSGPIDEWFGYKIGQLGYRTLTFEKEIHKGDYQGCAVMNYAEESTKYTRISEHKYFSPWESNDMTVIFKEYSSEHKVGDIPYYPIRLTEEKKILNDYIKLAEEQKKVSFLGRLGTYRYLDMDITIKEALEASDVVKKCLIQDTKIPVFFNNPL